jgi:hypothetical protein
VEMNEMETEGDCDAPNKSMTSTQNDSSDDEEISSEDPNFHAKQIAKKFKQRIKQYKLK